jgi:hypothetical protein
MKPNPIWKPSSTFLRPRASARTKQSGTLPRRCGAFSRPHYRSRPLPVVRPRPAPFSPIATAASISPQYLPVNQEKVHIQSYCKHASRWGSPDNPAEPFYALTTMNQPPILCTPDAPNQNFQTPLGQLVLRDFGHENCEVDSMAVRLMTSRISTLRRSVPGSVASHHANQPLKSTKFLTPWFFAPLL